MRKSQADHLEALIANVYDSAFEPSLWVPTLSGLADAIGASGAVIFGTPFGIDGTRYSPGLDETMDWYAREGTAMYNPRPERASRMRNKGPVLSESDLFTDWELEHIPFNAEINRFYRWEMGGVFSHANGAPLFLTAQRGHNTDRFGAAEVEIMTALFPHFERAAQVALRLNLAEAKGMLNAFEHAATGAVLLGRGGRILSMNPMAESLLGADLRVCDRRLEARDQRSNRDLQMLVSDLVTAMPELRKGPVSSAVSICRVSGGPVVVHGLPLSERGKERDIFQEARAVLALVAAGTRRLPAEHVLAQTYGLTGAEVRLANLLCEGLDLAEAANRLRVSRNTIRNQLKSIMHKTETNRQAELVSLLVHLAILPSGVR